MIRRFGSQMLVSDRTPVLHQAADKIADETARLMGDAPARGSKGAYNRPSYPCHYCTYRGGLLLQGAMDKAKADNQRHAGERQHHHLQVRKAIGGKQRKIVHNTPPSDVPPISRGEPAEGSWLRAGCQRHWAECGAAEWLDLYAFGRPSARVRTYRLVPGL